jgi:gamma-glutamylcyclotransferase (GGCT)/AIG2-like uncharacterized protein YtfP
MTYLFVYGTLKSDQSNHHRLAGQRLIGIARTTANYRLIEIEGRFESLGVYPGLVDLPYADVDGAGVSVMGEVWEVDDVCLAMLNAYEDLDSGEYVLAQVSLQEIGGDVAGAMIGDVPVMTYLYRWSIRGMRDCGVCWSAEDWT